MPIIPRDLKSIMLIRFRHTALPLVARNTGSAENFPMLAAVALNMNTRSPQHFGVFAL